MSYDEKNRNKYIVQIKTFIHVRIEALASSIRTCVIFVHMGRKGHIDSVAKMFILQKG